MYREQLLDILVRAEPVLLQLRTEFEQVQAGGAGPAETVEADYEQVLTDIFYSQHYCAASARELPPEFRLPEGRTPAPELLLTRAVDRALPAAPQPDPGWRFSCSAAADFRLERDGDVRVCADSDLIGPPGREATIILAGFLRHQAGGAGFNWIHSPMQLTQGPTAIRIYFNARAAELPNLLLVLAVLLRRYELPFGLKYSTSHLSTRRRDNVVLYLGLGEALLTLQLLKTQQRLLAALLEPEVPAFTLKVMNGVACAQNPVGGESFGYMRCQWLSQAVMQNWRTRVRTDTYELLKLAEARFTAVGVDLNRPYLNPNSRLVLDQWI
jgi:hypothetical protein